MPFAISNPKENIISGAKDKSFEFYHEQAHIIFNKSNLGMNIQWLGDISQFYTIISITLSFFIPIFNFRWNIFIFRISKYK